MSGEKTRDIFEAALALHRETGGKLEMASKVKVETLADLALVYTPGVAEACREIVRRPEAAYEVTPISHHAPFRSLPSPH